MYQSVTDNRVSFATDFMLRNNQHVAIKFKRNSVRSSNSDVLLGNNFCQEQSVILLVLIAKHTLFDYIIILDSARFDFVDVINIIIIIISFSFCSCFYVPFARL